MLQQQGFKGHQWKKSHFENAKRNEDSVTNRVEENNQMAKQNSVQKILNAGPFSKKSRCH
jgi:hypothetical protein